MIVLALVFVTAVAADFLSCEWQSARERGQLIKLGALSAVMEAMSWLPIFIAVFTRDIWLVGVAVVGSVIGSVIGGAREKARQQAETKPGRNVHEYMYGAGCSRPPMGWQCTRGYHTDGPCAAVNAVPTNVD